MATSDDLAERLAAVDKAFDEEFRPLFDAYIAAAGIEAPADDRRIVRSRRFMCLRIIPKSASPVISTTPCFRHEVAISTSFIRERPVSAGDRCRWCQGLD